jgi:2-C-methyl-D-erythritol 4-phosphate cytidylyltransferase
MNAETNSRHWAVVPAAGLGLRMELDTPKQYLSVAGQPIIQHTLQRMLSWGFLEQVVVVLDPDDDRWHTLPLSRDSRVVAVTGGSERSDSVLAGLAALSAQAAANDWVWVHDACRPCIASTDAQRLRQALLEDAVGGLLALQVADTVKRADTSTRVQQTLDRSALWLAQTPQLFRYTVLHNALLAARQAGTIVTDEAAAIEGVGLQPLLVKGDPSNIKLTRPEDLALVEAILGLGVE